MAKTKKIYYCTYCGARHSQWMGQCPSCKQWNTIEEEVVDVKRLKNNDPLSSVEILTLDQVDVKNNFRILTGDKELDTVLGGGLVPGSVILIGGEPGIGKSTLMLQTALNLPFKTLYVSGEESAAQIKMRASRIKTSFPKQLRLLIETDTDKILQAALKENPEVLIIDSIQTVHFKHIDSAPGTLIQIRESAAAFINYAKKSGAIVFIVGHINKEGAIAGPKILEHMVDTVLYFEGDRYLHYRILRALKNRFGNTHEIGIFEMTSYGLKSFSPSENLLTSGKTPLSGTAIGLVSEGIRAFAVETQALVSPAVYGTPQRSVTGYDIKRLNLILAVLEKRMNLRLSDKDVFLNIAGGMKILDSALDLAVAAAILSSYTDSSLPSSMAFVGEVGLTGEIRSVSKMEKRLAEAGKIGLEKVFVPPVKSGLPKISVSTEIVSSLSDLKAYFGL